jgi:hypothetical protein
MHDQIGKVRIEIGGLRKEMHEGFAAINRRLDQIIQTQLDEHATRIKKLEAPSSQNNLQPPPVQWQPSFVGRDNLSQLPAHLFQNRVDARRHRTRIVARFQLPDFGAQSISASGNALPYRLPLRRAPHERSTFIVSGYFEVQGCALRHLAIEAGIWRSAS